MNPKHETYLLNSTPYTLLEYKKLNNTSDLAVADPKAVQIPQTVL